MASGVVRAGRVDAGEVRPYRAAEDLVVGEHRVGVEAFGGLFVQLVDGRHTGQADLIREVRASGVSIVWIEHVVHALLATVDRLAVLHGGAIIADGDPHTVIKSPQVAEIYMGIAADA